MEDGPLPHFLLGVSIALVVIFSGEVLTENLSKGKKATQLGTWEGYGPERAVDGNTDPEISKGSCAHPHSYDLLVEADERGGRTWWSVDLSSNDPNKRFVLKYVVIYNRKSVSGRIIGTSIRTGDSGDILSQTQCAYIDKDEPIINKTCAPSIPVRYVTLLASRSQPDLGLCEVEVEGYEYKPCQGREYGQFCNQTCTSCPYACNDITGRCKDCAFGSWGANGCENRCHCLNDNVCDRNDGYCSVGCAAPYVGPGCSVMKPVLQGEPEVIDKGPDFVELRFRAWSFGVGNGDRPSTYHIQYFPRDNTGLNLNLWINGTQQKHNIDGAFQMITQTNLTFMKSYKFRILPYWTSQRQMGEGEPSLEIIVETLNTPPPTTTTTTTTTEPIIEEKIAPLAQRDRRTGMIVGIVIAMLLLLIVAVIAAVCVIRRRQGKPIMFWKTQENTLIAPSITRCVDPEIGEKHTHADNEGYDDDTDSVDAVKIPDTPTLETRISEHVYANPELLPSIPITELEAYIETKRNEPNAFRDEYKNIPIGATAKWDVGNKAENKKKNRFLNIRAYDHSRVVLDIEDDDIHSDYINADYISGYKDEPKTYIACQGPKKDTIDDMWRMIWQINTNRIVMVTNLIEGGKLKCDQYWPDRDSPTQTYGKVTVTLNSTELYADYVIRIFSLSVEDESRKVHQFHFTSWPDHGVPPVATSLLDFRRRVRAFDPYASGSMLVHCSAGVGRTGTFIAVDYLLKQAEQEKEINVYAFTVLMRMQRVNMIQTLDQYIFVYDAVLEAWKSGDTAIPTTKFKEAYEELLEEDPETNKTKLAKQFEVLESLKRPRKTEEKVGLEEANIDKNRSKDLVPVNRYRPYISTYVDGTTNYINAVYIDGYRSRNAYIATQMPLPHTVVDFWRMLYDHHSCSVIMLNEVDKNDETCGVYWPEEKEQSLTVGPLEVTLTNVNSDDPSITVREFSLSNNKSTKEPEVVKHFQFTSWSKDELVPREEEKLLKLLDMVERWQQQSSNGPITVQCMFGTERCGVLVALSFLLDKLKVDQDIDVSLAVKHVRIPRTELIKDLDQYKFLHEMALKYLDGFEEYSNFK